MRRSLLALTLAIFTLLTACAAPAAEPDSRWDPALKNALGLTPAQRLEDYDYFVKTLKDSYLCLGLRDRENPDDPAEDIFREYRGKRQRRRVLLRRIQLPLPSGALRTPLDD